MAQHLAMAVKIDPEQPTVSRLAAALDVEDSDLDLLEEFFLAATAAQGGQRALLGRKIFARLRAGASIAQAFGVSDGMIEFLYARAHRWIVVGRHEKAEPIFRVLCIIDGESADFWTGLGICLKARAAWDEAVAAFNMASQKRPQWPVPHFHALELNLRREAWTKAAAELAAFDEKADAVTPAVLRAEVEKYRKALQLRGGGGATAAKDAKDSRGAKDSRDARNTKNTRDATHSGVSNR